MKSKTFCIYPWISLMTKPTGQIGYCCIANGPGTSIRDQNNQRLSLKSHSLQEAWNSEWMKDLRKDMIEGTEIGGCHHCYFQENIGKKSYRQMHNEEWLDKLGEKHFNSIVQKSIDAGFVVDSQPQYLDLRLGNLCNLKCRMCNPYNSSQIHKEWSELDHKTNGEYLKFHAKHNLSLSPVEPWWESNVFWDSVMQTIPNLKKVYMTGGEPTLIEGNYRFLEECISTGYAKDIELFFNINYTNVTEKFIKYFQHFKWTSINASFDGYGKLNDYIRPPSKWQKLDENFKLMVNNSSSNVGLGVSPVIQVYNILDITELFDYIEEIFIETERTILVDLLFCEDPKYLDASILPKSIKDTAKIKIEEFKERSVFYNNQDIPNSDFIKNGIDSLMNLLNRDGPENSKELLNDFVFYTQTLDKTRNQNMQVVLPELHRLLGLEGYVV